MKSKAKSGLTPKMRRILSDIGADIGEARLRRNLKQEVVAERSFISVSTLKRLEKGDPSVSLGAVLSVLNSLSLEGNLHKVASIENDELGQTVALKRKRAN